MFLGPGETRCHDAPDNGRISFRHRPDFVVENTVSADVFRVNDPCGADGFLKRDRAAVDDKMVGEDLHKLEAAARVSSVRLVGHGGH